MAGIPVTVKAVRSGSHDGMGAPAIGGFVGLTMMYNRSLPPKTYVALMERDQVPFDPGCTGNRLYPDCSQWRHQAAYRTPRLANNNDSAVYPLDAESHDLRLVLPEETWAYVSMDGYTAEPDCHGVYEATSLRVGSGDAKIIDNNGQTPTLHVWGPATLEVAWC